MYANSRGMDDWIVEPLEQPVPSLDGRGSFFTWSRFFLFLSIDFRVFSYFRCPLLLFPYAAEGKSATGCDDVLQHYCHY